MLQRQKASHIVIDLQINKKEKEVKKSNKHVNQFQRDKDELIQEIMISKMQQRNGWKKKSNITNLQSDQEVIDMMKHQHTTQKHIKKLEYSHNLLKQEQDLTKKQLNKEKRYDEYVTQTKNRKLNSKYANLMEIQSDSSEQYQILDNFIKKNSPNLQIAPTIQSNHDRVSCKIHENRKSGHKINIDVQTNNQTTMVISKFYRSEHSQHKKIRKTETNSYQSSKSPIQIDTNHQRLLQKTEQKLEKSQNNHNKSLYKIAKIENKVNIQQFELFKYSINHLNKHQQREKQYIQIYQQIEGKISNPILKEQKIQIKPTKQDINNKKSTDKYQKIIKILQKESIQNIQTPKIVQKINNYDQQSNILNKIDQISRISPQISQQQVKQIFKIKNEQRFKEEIQSEDSKYNLNKKILPKKMKLDIFNGCMQLSYRKHFSQQQRQHKKECFQQNTIKLSKDNDQKGLIESIKPQSIKKHSSVKGQSDLINKESSIQKLTFTKSQKIEQVSMRQDIFLKINIKNAESSSSLVQQQINDNQTNNIDKIVSYTVNKATSNIQKTISKQGSSIKSNPEPSKPHLKSHGRMQQSQTISIMKIFGKPEDKRKQEKSQSIDFFAKLSNYDSQSHPSSVKQFSQKSEDKSQMMKHIKDLQSYSIDSQIFKKKSEILDQQIQDELHKPQISYEPIYESISQWRPNNLNYSIMQQINLSQDAISLSKFPDVSETKDIHNLKAKRMEIQQDQESDAQRVLSKTSYDSNIQAEIDQLQNYQSDQQQSKQPNKKYHQRFTQVLTPVLQQDLEQSQYPRWQSKKGSSK